MIAASVAAFATAWAAIGVQLASGHDPALAQKTKTTARSTTAQPAVTSTSSSAPSTSSQPLAPVTTQQS